MGTQVDGAASTVPARAHPWEGSGIPTSALGIVRRELTTLALVSQAVWILASPGLWPPRLPAPAAAAMMGVVVAWCALLAAQWRGTRAVRRWTRYVDVAAVALAAVVCHLVEIRGAEGTATLFVLCALLVGALIDVRVGSVALAVLALVALEPVVLHPAAAGEASLHDWSVAAYILVIGGCLLGVRWVLERNARRTDADIAQRDEIDRQRRTVEGVEAALLRQERLLHETVLNTLTAIHRGGLGTDAGTTAALQARCREAVDVLQDLESGAQALGPTVRVSATGFVSLPEELLAFLDGLRTEGRDIEVVTDSWEDVPDRVRGAISTAIREAVINAARHSGATAIKVLVRVRQGDGPQIRADVRDNGRGFDPRQVKRGFGLDRAIAGPMEEIGGTASVDSRPGSGTRVRLEWSARRRDPIDRFAAQHGRFALPAIATFGLYLAATAALAWLQFDHPELTAGDLALVFVLGVMIALATPEAPLPWGLVVTISVLGPLFALLALTNDGTAPLGGGWALAAIASLFMAAAAIGPRWSWVALLGSWLLVEGDPLASLVQPATLVVVGGAVLGRSLRRDTARMERAHEARVIAVSGLEVTRESLARLRSRYGPLEDSVAVPLLEAIIAGDLRPDDPDVQARAGTEEAFIRSLVRIDPETDGVRALVAELARAAHGRGATVRADLSLPPVPDVVVPAATAESLTRAVQSMDPTEPARVSARIEGDAVVVTLLAPIVEGERDRMGALPLPGVVTDPDDPGDPMMLWEARLPLAAS